MMTAANFLTMSGARLVLAETAGDLDTAPVDASCQIVGASVDGVERSTTIPATFCAPETEVALASGATLVLRFLQDWNDPAGVCAWLDDHDGQAVAFRLTLPEAEDGSTVSKSGTATARKPAFGGEGGSALETTLNLPAFDVTRTVTAATP